MARRQEYNGQGKTITATTSQQLTWTNTEISSRKIVEYNFATTGTNNTLGNLGTRLQVFANGFPIINMTGPQLQAYVERFTRSNFNLASGAKRFSIPFYILDAPTWDYGDIAQFPNNAQVQITLTTNASTSAGLALVGWTETDVEPQLMTKLLSSAMGISASASNQRFNFGENGVVRGLGINTVGVDQTRLVIAGESAKHATGALYLNTITADLSAEFEALAGGSVNTTDPIFHEITLNKAAPSQTSYVELTTQSTWGGTTNEVCVYALAPNLIQVAA